MEVREVHQQGNNLQLKLNVTNTNIPYARMCSPKYIINGVALIQVKVIVSKVNDDHINLVFVRFTKTRPYDDLTYTIKLNSNELSLKDKTFNASEGCYHFIREFEKQQYTIDIDAAMMIACHFNSFARLGQDDEFADFRLCGYNGSVRFHKAILASASPALRRMLRGKLRGIAHDNVPGVSKETLLHLKNYIYHRILPDKGLNKLIVLAAHYRMPVLEQKCANKLVKILQIENANLIQQNVV